MRKFMLFFCVVFVFGMTFIEVSAKEKLIKSKDKDMMRKMLFFNKENPDVFYCPVQTSKHMTSIDKMIVKAVPLKKLCEYEGQPIPRDAKKDCYNNVDETEFACKEKYRIMLRKFPTEFKAGKRLQRLVREENEMINEMVKNHKKN